MKKVYPNIIAYRGGSLQVVFTYQDANGNPFDVSGYDAVINIYSLHGTDPASTRAMEHSGAGELSVFYGTGQVKNLPEVARYEVMFTSQADPDVVFPVHKNQLVVASAQSEGDLKIESRFLFTVELSAGVIVVTNVEDSD